MRTRRRPAHRLAGASFALGVLLGSVGPPAGHASELPEWLEVAAARPTPASAASARAFVLLDEEHVTVPRSGRVSTTGRGAMRILTAEGRGDAQCRVVYQRNSTELRDLKLWVVSPQGRVGRMTDKDAIDVSLAGQALFSETRARAIVPVAAPIGSVVGWEWTLDEDPLLAHWVWGFEGELPVDRSRFVLTVPPGVTPRASVFHHAPIVPIDSGVTTTWELRDLRGLPRESLSPDARAVLPWLMVTLETNAGGRPGPGGLTFRDWTEVSRWYSGFTETQAEVTPEIAAAAERAVQGAGTPLERLRAIAAIVQPVNYVAVDIGLGRGEGYRPRPAAAVLRLGYGDCKDKSNLMRALLRAAGVNSWLTLVHSGAPGRVTEDWPSPAQFNHCILAVAAPEGLDSEAILRHPRLGNLLLFDPTDAHTPLGGLPAMEQGEPALIAAGDSGALVRLPVLSAARNRLVRRVDATLDANGGLGAALEERSCGSAAAAERAMRREREAGEYQRLIENWIAGRTGSAHVSRVAPEDRPASDAFQLQVDFQTPGYGRVLSSHLMAFRPAVVAPRTAAAWSDSARHRPIALEASSLVESVTVKLPEGFRVDELPPAVDAETDFGVQHSRWTSEPGELLFVRAVDVRRTVLPPERYADVRRFYERLRTVDQTTVVLTRP